MPAPLCQAACSRLLSTLSVLLPAAGVASCAERTDTSDGVGLQLGRAASSISPAADADAWRRYGECLKVVGLVLEDREDGQIRMDRAYNSEEKQCVGEEKRRALLPNELSRSVLSVEQLGETQGFSVCMRREGIPDHPDLDPRADEADVLGSLGTSMKGNREFNAALQVCGDGDSSTSSLIGG
ncbi:hypothetical protein ACWEPZ_16450 [Streptomyces sp. NPDC004288]